MGHQFQEIPLHRLNIPIETLRQSSTHAGDKALKESLAQHGILSPLVVTILGQKNGTTEYAVWDGTRRVRNLREMGLPTTTTVPAMIVEGDDQTSLVAQININNTRERLSQIAEAEALRQLVKDHGMKQINAAKALLKTPAWASEVMKVWELPREILAQLKSGEIVLSHARIIAGYQDAPDIFNMLLKQSLSGKVSRERLKAMGTRAREQGIKKALAAKPRTTRISNKSWLRVEPLQKGVRAELHLESPEEIQTAIEALEKQLIKMTT